MRKFSFKDTETGKELVLPVTPAGWDLLHGRKVNTITMHQVGDVNLPGSAVLLDQELTCLLPAHDYPFNQPGAGTQPYAYIEQLQKWSDAGTVLRFIVSDAVNEAVLLDPISYEERDGTGDLYCTIPIRGYRQLAAETVETADTGNKARAVETPPAKQTTYTVVKGDTLSGIARRFYGDASLYGKLAAANNIKNPNLIYAGQVLTIPDAKNLPAATPKAKQPPSVRAASQTEIIQMTGLNSGMLETQLRYIADQQQLKKDKSIYGGMGVV